jgi:ATP-dependent exoDNAse (exonuclease V) alpha subunit
MAAKVTLNEEQKEALKAIQKFIEHPAADIFVLKGYAGTGKTFLMQYLANWLEKNEHQFCLLASTGRAATVLRGKTGFDAGTVHGELYKFNKVDGDEEHIPDDATVQQFGQMRLLFFLRPPDDSKKIYIVDESSMLSSEIASDANTVSFGSGYLLNDFFECVGKNKIIFVGDPGQLPPVGQIFSPALDMEWLASQQKIAISTTLEKIERHNPDNDILLLASNIRSMSMDGKQVKFPKFPARNLGNVSLYPSTKALFDGYVEKYKEVGVNGALAVARSNKMVHHLNRALRRDLFGQIDLPIQVKADKCFLISVPRL